MSSMHTSFGLLFQAALYSGVLFGAAGMQAWSYFRSYYKRDSIYVLGLIAVVLVCDTCQIAFLCAALYDWLIINHGDPLILGHLPHTLIIELYFSAIIAFSVQQFYCYRIYMLSKSYIIAGVVSAASWSAFITLLIYSTQAMEFDQMAQLALLTKMSTITNSLAAVTDILISLVMVVLLQKSKTGFRKTTDLVNRLILFTFNAGLPTSVCALVAVITINAAPTTFLYIFFFILMGRFYTNSILVTLNSRDYIRDRVAESSGARNTFSLPVRSGSGAATGPDHGWRGGRSENNDGLAIRIDTSTALTHDQKSDDKSSEHMDPRKVDQSIV